MIFFTLTQLWYFVIKPKRHHLYEQKKGELISHPFCTEVKVKCRFECQIFTECVVILCKNFEVIVDSCYLWLPALLEVRVVTAVGIIKSIEYNTWNSQTILVTFDVMSSPDGSSWSSLILSHTLATKRYCQFTRLTLYKQRILPSSFLWIALYIQDRCSLIWVLSTPAALSSVLYWMLFITRKTKNNWSQLYGDKCRNAKYMNDLPNQCRIKRVRWKRSPWGLHKTEAIKPSFHYGDKRPSNFFTGNRLRDIYTLFYYL